MTHPLDRVTHGWMIATGRRVRADHVPWLAGPTGHPDVVGDEWVERTAAELSGRTSTGPDHGLLPDFGALAGPEFDPGEVDPRIADFYERTPRWQIDLWSQWSPVAWPFGVLLTALWSNRLQQLSLPMHPLDASFGMDSAVVQIHDADDRVAGAAWLRTMRKTGRTIYSGFYGTATLPGSDQPSVRVIFPLPFGSLPVLLRPEADNGGLHLHSPIGPFGSHGAYLLLARPRGTFVVRRIPVAEHFHLYVDEDGDVRADHSLRLGRIPVLRLHYRMRRA
ncbi:hypothetical protein [Saccharopolyspora taberi]